MKGTKSDSALKFMPQVIAELLGVGTNLLIWASLGFDMVLKELNLAGMLPPYGATVKITDTKVITTLSAEKAHYFSGGMKGGFSS